MIKSCETTKFRKGLDWGDIAAALLIQKSSKMECARVAAVPQDGSMGSWAQGLGMAQGCRTLIGVDLISLRRICGESPENRGTSPCPFFCDLGRNTKIVNCLPRALVRLVVLGVSHYRGTFMVLNTGETHSSGQTGRRKVGHRDRNSCTARTAAVRSLACS